MNSDYMEAETSETGSASGSTSSPSHHSSPRLSNGALGSANIHELLRATETERQSPAEQFRAVADARAISEGEWRDMAYLQDLSALTQKGPTFLLLEQYEIKTHACLVIVKQPGPVFVASAHTTGSVFHIQLLPHPLMPAQALKTWKVGPLKAVLLHDNDDETKLMSKKRSRPTKQPLKAPKRKVSNAPFQREYPFDKLDIVIDDLNFPASGCRPMRLEFSTTIMDPLGRVATFTAVSNAFMVISNCNQWKDGLRICLLNFVFPNGQNQAPFFRFYNYLHLAYLDSKGFSDERYLDPMEIKNWVVDSAVDEMRLDRDKQLLEMHNTVTDELFEAWFEKASPVLYDLHTSNVGKLFQKLWAAGYVGIGSHRFSVDDAAHAAGHCRLNINTFHSDDSPQESYLVLQLKDKSYSLLALERDHLSYFFEHSRNSLGCTHLISATKSNAPPLAVESLYTPRPGTPAPSVPPLLPPSAGSRSKK